MLFVPQDTFNHLSRTWIKKVEVHGPPNVQLMLLGNKCDLRADKRNGGSTGVDYIRAKVYKRYREPVSHLNTTVISLRLALFIMSVQHW